jgi:PAB1-binding protein PBP1
MDSNGDWDQFAANDKLFGLPMTDFDELSYTTTIDRTGADYGKREEKVTRLSKDIQSVFCI